MRKLALTALLALTACATALPQIVERDGETFDVRYDAAAHAAADIDAEASAHCAGAGAVYVGQQTGFDGLVYRTYRCAIRRSAPETVSVLANSDADATAQRECGGPARPETVSHETNVIIYRCVRPN